MAGATKGWRWRAVCLVLLPGAAYAAGPVSLRPTWTIGAERRYDLATEYIQSSPDAEGQQAQRRVSQNARLLVHVDEVDAAGGATVRLSFETLHTELVMPDGDAGGVFDWPPASATPPATPPGTEPAADAKPSALDRLCGALAGCTLVVAVAPDGSVTTVTGLLPLAKALQQEGGDGPALQAIGFFSPVRLKANLATLWSVDADRRAREPGSTWRATEHLALGPAYAADASTVWTLSGVEGSLARISAAVTLSTTPSTREADPAAPRLSLGEQHGTITAEWDIADGLLASRIEDIAVTWTATVDLGPGATTPSVSTESKASSKVRITLVK